MNTNQTTNVFTIFGAPAKVVANKAPYKNKYVIGALLADLTAHPDNIKSFVISRINGVVKVNIATR